MDIRDFQGTTKYKIIIPALYIINWISMFAGPSLYPLEYQKYCIIILLFLVVRIMMMAGIWIKITATACSYFDRIKTSSENQQYQNFTDTEDELYYGFIIPNYKEDIQLLSETLDFLAAQKRAKQQYLIFLAMQAHQPDSDLKAHELIQNFSGSFRVIQYTRHQIRENQQKGKASNVSWCAQHLEPIFEKHMINPDSVFLTIIDADSWAPEIYFDVVDEHIRQNYDERFSFIYQPNQIFTRNNLDVPIMTRICDIVHSFAHSGNLYSCFDFTFPLSNYTLSFNLAKRMGYWDTCADAIGQDFHTTQKAYWKTQGNIKTVPIYTPFNQVNIATGNGYWADMKARFWQAQRHARGVADVAYNLKMLFNQPFRIKNLYVVYCVFETFFITTSAPWILISMNYQSKILYHIEKPSPELYSDSSLSYLFTMMTIFGTFSYICYEYTKRRTNTLIYKRENESLLRMLEYAIFFMPCFLFVSTVTFVIASFSTLFGNQEYVVADKKNVVKRKEIQS